MFYPPSQPAVSADRLFDRMYLHGRFRQIMANLTRKPWRLLDLNDTASLVKVDNRHYAGIKTVSIHEIKGSLGRSRDFERHFFPVQKHTQSRWISIAAAHMAGIGMPIIELVCVMGQYYVQDGHHRISVAKAIGILDIEAVVTVWDTSRLTPMEI